MAKMDIETCKKILYESRWDKKQQGELERLTKKKDKDFRLALVDIACRLEQSDCHYSDNYVKPACEAMKEIGDASVIKPLLEFLDGCPDEKYTNASGQCDKIREFLDGFIGPRDLGPYRGLLERLSAHTLETGRFGSSKLLVLEAAEKGSYERLKAAEAGLAWNSDDQTFTSALQILREEGSGLAINYMIDHSCIHDSKESYAREPRVKKVDDVLVEIGAPAVPLLVCALRETNTCYARDHAYELMERIGEAAVPALLRRLGDDRDFAAYPSLERLYKGGKMSAEDKKSLLAMNGKVLRAHTDESNECGVHTDVSEVKVSL